MPLLIINSLLYFQCQITKLIPKGTIKAQWCTLAPSTPEMGLYESIMNGGMMEKDILPEPKPQQEKTPFRQAIQD